MILQKLVEHYHLLADEPTCEIPRYGYAICPADYLLTLSAEGDVCSVAELKEGKTRCKLMLPFFTDHTNATEPFFSWDNNKYALGLPDNDAKNLSRFQAFATLHHKLLANGASPEVKALLAFLDNWQPGQAVQNKPLAPFYESICKGGNIVFRLEGSSDYLHNCLEIKQAWLRYLQEKTEDGPRGICLVSGQESIIKDLHPTIKNLTRIGANAKGGAIVSFNDPAFCSYGKEQSYNAPVGSESVFAYTTVLNSLLADKRSYLDIDNMTLTFWANKPREVYADLTRYFLEPNPFIAEDAPQTEREHDEETRTLLLDLLSRAKSGLPLTIEKYQLDENAEICLLGLTANNARLAISLWYVNSFGKFAVNLSQHYQDTEICNNLNENALYSARNITRETVPKQSANKKAANIFTAALLRAIIDGGCYPSSVYSKILMRIKIDKDINAVRIGFIKAYLLRQARFYKTQNEGEMTVSLNKENRNTAYRLGRLFAVLEKAQKDALGENINTTIKDSYFGSAMTTPAAVFPRLLKLSIHHTSHSDYGYIREKEKQEIFDGIEATTFPAHLSLEEQGMFALGYYHQNAAFYTKKDIKNKED